MRRLYCSTCDRNTDHDSEHTLHWSAYTCRICGTSQAGRVHAG